MELMAKPRKTKKPEAVAVTVDDPVVWRLFTKIDIALKKPFDDYLKSLEYEPDQARVIEKMFREFLQARGFWPEGVGADPGAAAHESGVPRGDQEIPA